MRGIDLRGVPVVLPAAEEQIGPFFWKSGVSPAGEVCVRKANVVIHTLCCELFLPAGNDPGLSGRRRGLPARSIYFVPTAHLGDPSF